jgi:gamma-glutamyltranspeptidase/glutathione hydrolase
LIKFDFRSRPSKAGYRRRSCQWLCAGLLAAAVAGCESGNQRVSGEIGSVSGFAGAVAADEPRAVLAARDALAAGGSAADAATALYFALAVTLPSSAGLGGGGVCLVHAPNADRPYVLDFLPRASADGSIGLPGNARGMAFLQARHGRMKWSQLLAPAEELARGTSVSRALAADLAANSYALLGDAGSARVFGRADGGIAREGDGIRQLDLVGTISQIRREGAGALYAGPLAIRLALAAQDADLALSNDTLRAVQPRVRDALVVGIGARATYFAPPPADGGLLGAHLAAMLAQGGSYAAGNDVDRAHLFVEAAKRAVAETDRLLEADGAGGGQAITRLSQSRMESLMQDYVPGSAASVPGTGAAFAGGDPGATGFVVADGDGLAIACEVTLNRPFGNGRVIPGTGVILAAPPAYGGAFPLGPMIAIDPDGGTVDFVGAASGGARGTQALIAAFLDTVVRGESLGTAIAAGRVLYPGTGKGVAYEDGVGDSVVAGLSQRGHVPERTAALGRVNALWCSKGLPDDSDSCEARNDPRGNGLAVIQAD